MSDSTVKHIKTVISQVLDCAIDDEIIEVNPALGIRKLFKRKSIRIEPPSKKEVDKLLNIIKEDWPEHYCMTLIIARCGLRLGEATSLKWQDINFEKKYMTIQRSTSRKKLTTPKNHQQRRVNISNQLLATLNEHKQQSDNEWLFPGKTGLKPLDSDSWRKKVFNKAVKKAKLSQNYRPHDLRHFYATALIEAGTSLAFVQKQLGHHSIQITVDTYGHLSPDSNAEYVNILDN